MKTDNNIKKENFVQILSTMTPEQINQLIQQKGKKPKPIPMVLFY